VQRINCGLIVSDFDGTLVNDDGTICEKNKQAIAKYRENGGVFAISTGRLPSGILPRAKELGLKGIVACCQGAVIVDIESNEVIFQDKIPNAVAIKVCRKIEEMDLHLHVYDVWGYYCNKDDDALKFYQAATRTQAELVLDRPISEVLKETGKDVCKFLIMIPPKENERVRKALEKENFEGCEITKSSEFLVEVINARCSKGTAVEFLAKHYQIPMEKTVAIGDQWNDIPMIQTAGIGIAVKNADKRLKSMADEVSEYTNEEGAVANAVEKYGFTE
jgi:Cof subfamily protein (haloacid dehalogenase superfamily)